MFQRLAIPFEQVKEGNNWEKLLNEIIKNFYSLYQSKEIIKKEYNNITKSKNKTKKKIEKVDTTFMNSEDSETSKAHVLILKLTDKIDFRRGEKSIASSNLSIYGTWKNIKNSYNINK